MTAINQGRITLLEQRLQAALAPQDIHIIDDSAAHAGHAGAKGGAGHFDLTIVAQAFVGKSRIQRHQLVYAAVNDLIPDQVHALSIKTLSPDEL